MDRTVRVELLELARCSIRSAFTGEPLSIPDTNMRRGAFVTLRIGGELRGCIGYLEPVAPLFEQIAMLARDAAFKDHRFDPLTAKELELCRIEISLLSHPVPILSTDDFVMGEHGIIMSVGNRRAVFLPQVAEETGWSKDELLSALGRKAGLPPDAWKAPDASFSVFTAEVFSE